MILQPLSYAHILAIADVWRDIGGNTKVEIGALEPLLWRDGQYRITDVVRALAERDLVVSMTTNGQLLDIFAKELGRSGLSLIRTSWHTTNPLMFKEISGGHGEYGRFKRGVTMALESGIKVAFNRVLIKGHTEDLPEQLEFIEQYKSRLKLLMFLWTPQNASLHESFYQDWRPLVRASILPRTHEIVRVRKLVGRDRLRFVLAGGGCVEVKLGDRLKRNLHPCATCSMKHECKEGFGDYVRVDPNLHLYFCYLRQELGFPISEYFGRPQALKQRLQDVLGDANVEDLLSTTSLRLTVTPTCNFACRIPGTSQGWCMERREEYRYPHIRTSLFGKV